MKRLFLTGSSGFFGTHIRQALEDRYQIIPSFSRNLDITDEKAVLKALITEQPDYVVHAAAIANSQGCKENPQACQQLNVIGTRNIAQACAEAGAKLIFLSTEQVFDGNTESGPYKETDTPLPTGDYGKSKLQAEEHINQLCSEYVILRLNWLFDYPRAYYAKPLNNILMNTIGAAIKGKSISAPVHELRGVTWISHLMDAFPSLMDLPSGIYHAGSENPLNRYETVQCIVEEMGYDPLQLLHPDTESFREHPRDLRLDTSKIKEFGILFPPSDIALRDAIAEYRAHLP